MADKTLDFISIVPWTVIVMMANAYILYRIMRRFLFKPVQEMFKKRQEEVDAVYAGADNLQKEAETAKRTYEEKLDLAGAEAAAIITRAQESARLEQEHAQEESRRQTQKMLQKAEQDVQQVRKKAAAQMQQEISDMAVEIAGKITEKEIRKSDHERLIEDCIRQMEEDAV